ncbi:MAG: RNA polymerase sigma factor [Nannocystales bacterium]
MRADRELFEAWSAGDQDAGSQLIDRHYDAIVRFFRTKSPSAVDDLTQRTFLRCAEVRSRFRGEASVRTFLFGIARNVLFEHIRGRVRDARVCPDVSAASLYDLDPGVHTQASERDDHRVLLAALHRLPLDLQLLLELYYWENLGVTELGELLGVPGGTVKSRLHRARKLLREAVDQVPADLDIRTSVRDQFAEWMSDAGTPSLG